MTKFFHACGVEHDYVNDRHCGYHTQVFTHFSALQGMKLDYYGADSASHEFKVEGIVFKVLEDPDDGYRSHLGAIEYGEQSSAIFFRQPIAKVAIEMYDGENRDYLQGNQGYRLVDVKDGHVWLEFGTDNTDDYYPCFVFRHMPKEQKMKSKSNLYDGITFHEEDRKKGSFTIRIEGTNEFVSGIDPHWKRAHPPGKVEVVEGWNNRKALKFNTMDAAIKAAHQVWDIEGFHTSIEAINNS